MRRIVLLALVLFAAALAPRPSLAVPAAPADAAFEVTEHVDGAGQSSSEAYSQAVNGGRRKAWELLVHKLTPQDQWPKLAALDDATLQRMVKSYKIANERRSTTRYSADVTYIFNEALVRHYSRLNNVTFSATASTPMLVVPMAPGYAPDSPWARAWTNIHMAAGVLPLVLPDPDPLNRTALGPVGFDTAVWSDLGPVAARAHAAQAAVVQAGPGRPGHMAVGVRLLYPNQSPQALVPLDVPVPAHNSPDQNYVLAAQAAASAIGEAWKSRNAIDFSKRFAVTVNVAIDTLGAWGQMQQRLIKIPVVMNIRVEAMAIGQVRAVVTYVGSQQQFQEALGPAGFSLQARDGETWLTAAPPPAP